MPVITGATSPVGWDVEVAGRRPESAKGGLQGTGKEGKAQGGTGKDRKGRKGQEGA